MTPRLPKLPALFIVLEGIDGSGTTTQLERVTRHLRKRGRSALATREPSVGPIGRLLREILLGQHRTEGGDVIDGRAMALLFAADRRDHLAREIEPALAAETDVVSDRYALSSFAYQAVEADRVWVRSLAEGIRPADLTVLLDVSVEVAAERRRLAGRAVERYDSNTTLARVAENYRRLAASHDAPGIGRMAIVDASRSIDEVERAVTAEVDSLLADPPGDR